jgi:hypothetical protein
MLQRQTRLPEVVQGIAMNASVCTSCRFMQVPKQAVAITSLMSFCSDQLAAPPFGPVTTEHNLAMWHKRVDQNHQQRSIHCPRIPHRPVEHR